MCSDRWYVGNLDCPLHLSVNLKMLKKKKKEKSHFTLRPPFAVGFQGPTVNWKLIVKQKNRGKSYEASVGICSPRYGNWVFVVLGMA